MTHSAFNYEHIRQIHILTRKSESLNDSVIINNKDKVEVIKDKDV